MKQEDETFNLAQDYHRYLLREKTMKYLQIGSLATSILGSAITGTCFHYGKNTLATANLFCSVGMVFSAMGAGKLRRDYVSKVRNIESKLRGLDEKLSEKRDPLSLPIQTKRDTEKIKHRVITYNFYRI